MSVLIHYGIGDLLWRINMASRYEEVFGKAIAINDFLGENHVTDFDARVLRGIGYALLAIAQAIKDGAREITEEMAYARRTRPKD